MTVYEAVTTRCNRPFEQPSGKSEYGLDSAVRNLKWCLATRSVYHPDIKVGQVLENILEHSSKIEKPWFVKAAEILRLDDYKDKKVTSYLPKRYYKSNGKLKMFIPDSL